MSGSSSILDRIANPTVANVNPLANYKAALDVNNALNDNKLFQANALRGQLLQQATDPDGTVNMPRYNQLASQAGDALAPAMAAGVDQSQAIAGSQQDQALKSLKTQQGMLGSLMSDNDGAGPDYQRVLDTIKTGLQTGAVQPHGAQAVLTGMPTGDDPKSRATRLHQIQTINEQLSSAEQRLSNATATAGTMSNNQVNQPGVVGGVLSGQHGVFRPTGPGVQLQTGPETNAAQSEVYVKNPDDPPGVTTYIKTVQPRSALPGASGVTPSVTPGAVAPIPGNGSYRTAGYKPRGALGGGPQGADPTQTTTPAPSTTPAPPAATTTPPAAPTQTPAPVVLAAPPQGQAETIKADQDMHQQHVAAMQQQNAQLINLDTAHKALSLVNSGRGSEQVHNMWSFLTAQGFAPAKGTDVANYDIARKAMYGFIDGQAQSGGTDLGLSNKMASNASMEIDHNAALHVLAQNIGLQRQKIAQTLEEPAGGLGTQEMSKNFPNDTDYRAFAIDKLSPPERAQLIAEAAKEGPNGKIHRSIDIARNHHLIPMPAN